MNEPWMSAPSSQHKALFGAHPSPIPEEHVAVLNFPRSTTRTVRQDLHFEILRIPLIPC